jgi:hypothetical protein
MMCQCGCGQLATISKRTDPRFGWVKGQPRRFLRGHHRRLLEATGNRYLRARVAGVERPAHVVVAEKALGRALPMGAQVHHVDTNRKNNAAVNLVICQDHAYHRLLHARMRVVKAGGNPNSQNLCRVCRRCMSFERFHLNAGNGALGTCTICKECQSLSDSRRHLRNKQSLKKEQRLSR